MADQDPEVDAALEAEMRRRGLAIPGAQPPTVDLSFKPGEQAAPNTPEVAALEAELKRRGLAVPGTPAPAAAPPASSGVQLSGEAAPEPAPETGWLPEALTPQRFSKDYDPEAEALPDLIRAPAIRTLSGATAMFTNSGADDVEKILKKNIPGTEVEARGGYRIYRFPGDPQPYAWKQGIHPSDIVRALPAAGAGIAASLALPATLPVAIATGAAEAALGEGAKYMAGADPSGLNVAIGAGAPLIAPVARGVSRGVGKLADYMAQPIEQTVADVAPALPERFKQLLTGWGAHPDIHEIGQQIASLTQPVVDQAESAAARAAAAKEAAIATAAARKESGTLAATTAAEDAVLAARTKAEDAAAAIRATGQDAVSSAAAKAEADKAAAAAPVHDTLAAAKTELEKWGAQPPDALDRKAMDRIRGIIEDSKNASEAGFRAIRKVVPKTAPTGSRATRRVIGDTVAWIDSELAGNHPDLQSPMLKEARKVLTDETEPLMLGSVTSLRQAASRAGHAGSKWTDADQALGKELAGRLKAIEYSVFGDFGHEKTIAKLNADISTRKTYEKAVSTAVSKKGAEALNASLVPSINRAGTAMVAGNVKPLEDLMKAVPKGLQQSTMASIVQQAILEGAPKDPTKAAQHVVDFVNRLKTQNVVRARVFGWLPEEAKRSLLDIGARAEASLASKAAGEAAADAERAAAEQAAGRATAAGRLDVRRAKNAEMLATRRGTAEALAELERDTAVPVAAAKADEASAKAALDAANAANINLAAKIPAAGKALAKGNVEPFTEILKAAPGREQELAASTYYHATVNPTDTGLEGLKRIAKVNAQLEASPGAAKLLLDHLPPGAPDDLKAFAKLAAVVHSGSKKGTERAGGFLRGLASMGAWSAGKGGGIIGGTIGAAAGLPFGPGVSAVGGGIGYGGGYVVGKMLASTLAGNPSVETKAANAFLASAEGKALLKRFALDKELPQGFFQKVGHMPGIQKLIQVSGQKPGKWLRAMEQSVRFGGAQALSSNNTKE